MWRYDPSQDLPVSGQVICLSTCAGDDSNVSKLTDATGRATLGLRFEPSRLTQLPGPWRELPAKAALNQITLDQVDSNVRGVTVHVGAPLALHVVN